jgi:hypothetical protein
MFFPLADSSDPKLLASFLHPSYPGTSYEDRLFALAVIYSGPLVGAALLAILVGFLVRRRLAFGFRDLPVMFAPGVVWVLLVYADASRKALGNVLELAILGVVAGIVVGLGGRLLTTARQTWLWSAGLAAAAFALWLCVPRWLP